MGKPRTRTTLPRSVRIRSRADFKRMFEVRLRASDRWITLYGRGGPARHARLGIAVGRAVGSAVHRNRRKRLVREAFRRIRHELPPQTDWVIVLRPGPEPTVGQLQDSIRQLARRLSDKMKINHGGPETRRTQERES
ncbi:MAG TPA: ribonuclease P protein component [Phycisphaerae bacterium]|nr:ribonuclease P protein component [Phycisphaerae bacterium]